MTRLLLLGLLASCAAPPQTLTSETANTLPNCVSFCHVTVNVVEGNRGDGGLTTVAGSSSVNTRAPVRTTTLTDQSGPLGSQY